MTPMQPRTGRLDDHDIRNMAAKALDKIISASKPKLVVWDVMNRRLRVISVTAGYAKDCLKKPTQAHMALIGLHGDSYPPRRKNPEAARA